MCEGEVRLATHGSEVPEQSWLEGTTEALTPAPNVVNCGSDDGPPAAAAQEGSGALMACVAVAFSGGTSSAQTLPSGQGRKSDVDMGTTKGGVAFVKRQRGSVVMATSSTSVHRRRWDSVQLRNTSGHLFRKMG